VVVGDVSGHSLSSALLAAATSAHIRSNAELCHEIGDIVAHANRLLFREMNGESFVTLFFLRIDPRRRFLHYVNAGHPSGYVLDGSGDVKAVLKSESLPLAVLSDTEFPVIGPVNLATGDTVLIVSDGVLEAQSPEGQAFGSDRGDHGNVVHQMMCDYQKKEMGGLAYLRLLEFAPDGETVQVWTYSPYREKMQISILEDFVFKLQDASAAASSAN
jgi:serine phosphatase RsbU (regulator of sigma subunit)